MEDFIRIVAKILVCTISVITLICVIKYKNKDGDKNEKV